jgi:hypothetical protein
VKYVLRALSAAGLVLAFTRYLKQSRSVSVRSDGGSVALQAWDMLHGNLLLHGWAMSDVPYYSTGLPEFMLLERLGGLGPEVVHTGGALTYVAAVAVAALVAKGRATGPEGVARVLIAAGIMLAPAPGDGTYTLLMTPDHFTSALPVLLAWLIVDRCQPCWYVPAGAGLMLAWGLVGDPLTEVIGVLPVIAVCAFRIAQRLRDRYSPERPVVPGSLAPWWFEASLVAASVGAVGVSAAVSALMRADGGFTLAPVSTTIVGGSQLLRNASLTGQGLLELFGALFGRGQPVNMAFSVLHLAGAGLAAVALVIALRRLGRRDELMVPALALAIVGNVALYLPGWYVQDLLSTREISAVLPLGAALAGRVLAARLSAAGLAPALAVLATGYLLGLGTAVTRPAVPAQATQLASWLSARHLTYGLSGYWQATVVTLETGGRVSVRPVVAAGTGLARDDWEVQPGWYDPARHQADFIVLSGTWPGKTAPGWMGNVRAAFGQPARVSYVGPYTVLVYSKNLLGDLRPGG